MISILNIKKEKMHIEYSRGIKGIFQRLGLISVYEKKYIQIKLKNLENAKLKLKDQMVFSLNQTERVQFRIYLLLEYLEKNPSKDDFATLIKADPYIEAKEAKRELPFRINKLKFHVQDLGCLYFKDSIVDYISVQIQLPSFLKVLSSNAFYSRDNTIKLTIPFLNPHPLEFVCLAKGRGSILFTLTHEKGDSIYELGIVEVLE